VFPDKIIEEMKKYGDDENVKDRHKMVLQICLKGLKERSYHDKRRVCNYLKEKVNFFKDVEKEKLETIARQILVKEYEPGEISKASVRK
jgi:hypothetical protein